MFGQGRNFMQTQKIVRRNQENVCGNKRIMLTKGGLCKRKSAETVERIELSRLRKKTQPVTFSKYKCKFIINIPVRRYMMISMGSESTGLGLTVRSLQETKGMSREVLVAGIAIRNSDMKQIIRYSHMEELTQELVDTFIERIYVYKDKRMEIEWKFRETI